jgi:TonB family protein
LDDKIIKVSQPDVDSSSIPTPASGGPAVPELPDVIMVLPDKVNFMTPVVDHPRRERFATSLKGIGGPVGPDTGAVPTAGISFIDFRKLDRQPRATAQISPEYQPTTRQQRIAGSVNVEFDVNTEGKVVRAEAVRYTRREFAEPALRAVRNWHFEPGKRGGYPVPFRMAVPIEFGLD